MDFRNCLERELERRKGRNRRYSLRAFAMNLGVSHSTLSRLLRRPSRLTPRMVHQIGSRLGLSPEETRAAILHETTAAILGLLAHPRFRPDCRWLAMMTGVPLDEVNVGLHHLLRARRLSMLSAHQWQLERT